MMHFQTLVLMVTLAATASACQFIARSPKQYAEDAGTLIAKSNAKVKDCYDGVLKGDKSAKGTVTVNFTVNKETGTIGDVKADAANSTAPESVHACVVSALDGLTLDPPDQRVGLATFRYELSVKPQ